MQFSPARPRRRITLGRRGLWRQCRGGVPPREPAGHLPVPTQPAEPSHGPIDSVPANV